MTRTHRQLAGFLRLNALILLSAVIPLFFPTEWMAAIHCGLGLGPFPSGPLTDYLTRSAAACYALHGGVLWLIGGDVRRYQPLIRPVYCLHLLFAIGILGIDLVAGMPTWWIVLEITPIISFALAALWLNSRINPQSASTTI
jgi:hypothetical protein